MRAESLYGLLFVFLMGGVFAASYAAYEVVNPAASAVCSTSGYVSCGAVADSGHTTILGVPDWLVGIAGYLAMFVVAVLAYRTYERRYLVALTGLSTLGLLVSLFFVYNELVVIQHLCPVCTAAHLLNVGVLAVSVSLLRLGRSEPEDAGGPGPRPAPSGAKADGAD